MFKFVAVLLLSVSVSASASEQGEEDNDSVTEMEMIEANYSILQKLLNQEYKCDDFPLCELDAQGPSRNETDEQTVSDPQNDGTQPESE